MRVITFDLAMMAALSLSGCGNSSEYDLSIENHDWEISVIQDGETGEAISCSEKNAEFYPEAQIIKWRIEKVKEND